jgi:hypothetical protein
MATHLPPTPLTPQYLLDEGFVTRAEYDERRAQLVDELTGTSQSQTSASLTASSVSSASNTATRTLVRAAAAVFFMVVFLCI